MQEGQLLPQQTFRCAVYSRLRLSSENIPYIPSKEKATISPSSSLLAYIKAQTFSRVSWVPVECTI